MKSNRTQHCSLVAGGLWTLFLLSTQLLLTSSAQTTPYNNSNKNRTLNEKQATRDFVPLSCNAAASSSACQPWSQVFGRRVHQMNRVYIPCGECVDMDVHEVYLHGGIDVQGKWVIRKNEEQQEEDHHVQFNITTTGIFIQGEWHVSMMGSSSNRKLARISGTPLLKITMVGEEEEEFTPILENADACGDGANCQTGMKGIVVAGGSVQIRGLFDNTPTWLKLHDVIGPRKTPRALVVDRSVLGHWSVGAEILITAHSTQWDDHQVRTITRIRPHELDDGYAEITLNEPIRRPTTATESPDYAVEVALLSRNILFEGGPDSVANNAGGHFWIMNTPGVPQTLQGVEVRKFGQQGTLGRYPIHVHFCGDSPQTLVAQNTIRESQQRCIVVHGTNKLKIKSNVAYHTKGHCFMLEDGMEVHNQFLYNLGAQTGAPAIVIPDYGTNGYETDWDPSTFWITNPTNTFVGNVVAGSESSGFWFELLVRGERAHLYPDLNPKREPLGHFRDNTVHSCQGKAIRTYPTGYVPEEEALFIGIKAFRNANTGVFFHNSRNLAVVNSLFADNRFSVDIDRSENVRVQRSTFIGKSDAYGSYLELMDIPNVCRRDNWPVVGVELHTWMNNPDREGATFRNVTFTGFANHPCTKSVPVLLDDTTKTGKFDHYSSFRSVLFERGVDPLDFCLAADIGINDVYLADFTGDTFAETEFRGISTAVSDDPLMLNFVQDDKCVPHPERCYSLCEDTCFFTTRFEIDPSETVDYQLKVCLRSEPKRCVWVDGYHRHEDYDFGMRHRMFAAHLPVGVYDAEFVNSDNESAWPSFANKKQDTHFCPQRVADQEVRLKVPVLKRRECKNLIKNGKADASDLDPTHWVYRFGDGIQVVPGAGAFGSNAIAGNLEKVRSTLGQYLDNRCFSEMEGATYKIEARVKVFGPNDEPLVCENGKREGCPFVGIHTQREGFNNIARITDTERIDGFYTFVGEFELDGMFGVNDEVFFYVDSTFPRSRVFIDSVSITQQEQDEETRAKTAPPSPYPTQPPSKNPTSAPHRRCDNLIQGARPGQDPKEIWGTKGFGTIRSAPGMESDSGMRFTDRIFSWNGPTFVGTHLMDYTCLTFGSSWTISAYVKLMDTISGKGVSCIAGWTCPAIRVAITDGDGNYIALRKVSQYTASPWNAKGFNEFKAFVELPRKAAWDGTVGDVFIDIRDYPVGVDLIVDGFSMTPSADE